jgi:hypothetical protein
MLEQETYSGDIMRINERHFAVTFLLDTSGSMGGEPIQRLNDGLNGLVRSLQSDDNADIIDIAVITFGDSVNVTMPHTPISRIKADFNLSASGWTPMGEGLLKAAEITNERRRLYNANGVMTFKPWIFMITDGEPTDSIESAKQELMKLQDNDKLKLWILGIPGYNKEPLKGLTKDGLILELRDFDLKTALNWVNKSMANVSHSAPGEMPKMAPLESNMGAVQLDAY